MLRTFASLVLVALCGAVVHAQSLQRLTVTQLVLSSDTSTPKMEQPFHLIITAHVREDVTELDNLDLPILAELELLGDEHTLAATPAGTTYRETITVVAHRSGTITIAPVTLDAIDVRDGKATRYSSNALTLHVAGISPITAAGIDVWAGVRAFFSFLVRLVLWAIGIGAVLLVLAVLVRRRPRPVPVVELPPPTPVERDRRSILRDALDALRGDPTRAGAMRARHIVRTMVGASDLETLGDVLRRPAAADPQLREALRALERAGFTHEADLRPAVSAATAQLERMTS